MTGTVSPGRVEILGNHTDYNEGLVILATFDRSVRVAGRARADGRAIIHSGKSRDCFETARVAGGNLEKTGKWPDYLRGVAWSLARSGVEIGGFECRITSDLPSGVGLSSSAALEVSFCLFLKEIFGFEMSRLEMARVCQRAENDFVGVSCGILDQYACLFGKEGHLIFLDCRELEHCYLPVPRDLCFVVCDSGTRRTLGSTSYNERRMECSRALEIISAFRPVNSLRELSFPEADEIPGLAEKLRKRVAHVTGENKRVSDARKALEESDPAEFGRLMVESHESSRLLFENSLPEIDFLVEKACEQPGVYGARITGAGWGGALVILARQDAVDALSRELTVLYRSVYGREARFFSGLVPGGARVEQNIPAP